MGHILRRQTWAGTELALVAAGGFQVEAAVVDCRQQTNRFRLQRMSSTIAGADEIQNTTSTAHLVLEIACTT